MSETTATRKPRQRKPLAPVHGSARLLQAIGTVGPVCNRVGEVSIDGKAYFCRCTATAYQLFGFDQKKGEPTHYDLPLDCSSCDCPDQTYRADRPGGCKHMAAMRALKAAGKLACVEDVEADALAEQWRGIETDAA
jgi:hypothetical protein